MPTTPRRTGNRAELRVRSAWDQEAAHGLPLAAGPQGLAQLSACSRAASCCVSDKDSTRKGTLSLIKLELKSHLVKCLRVFVFITSKKLTCGSEFCFPVESEKPCVKTHNGSTLASVSVKGPLRENNFKLIKNNSSGIKEMCQNNSKQLK